MTQLTEAQAAFDSARAAFEGAASRGFPEHNRYKLEGTMRGAKMALDMIALACTKTDAPAPIDVAWPDECAKTDAPTSIEPPTTEAKAYLDSLDPAPYPIPDDYERERAVAPAGPVDMKVYDQIAERYNDSVEGPTT